MKCGFRLGLAALLVLPVIAPLSPAFGAGEQKWVEVHTAHFSVITDAGDKRGGKLRSAWSRCGLCSDNC